jgi:SAM-dependent methyltransferase
MTGAESRERFARLLPAGASVLDVGCWNYGFWRFCEDRAITGLVHSGIDRETPSDPLPDRYSFRSVDLESTPFPFADASFDGVFASHVIEHLARPLAFVDEVFRVLKPDGFVYIECPSDRSLWLPSMPFGFDQSRSLNFFDDPTHVGRPQTPQSLHRLFRMYGAEVLEARYLVSTAVRLRFPWLIAKALWGRDAAMLEEVVWRAFGFAVFGLARKGAAARRHYVLS